VFGVETDDLYQNISYLDYLDYAEAEGSFSGVAAAQAGYAASVRRENLTEVAFLEAVSGDYFSVLDIDVHIGRGVHADDDQLATDAVAVISYDCSARRSTSTSGRLRSSA